MPDLIQRLINCLKNNVKYFLRYEKVNENTYEMFLFFVDAQEEEPIQVYYEVNPEYLEYKNNEHCCEFEGWISKWYVNEAFYDKVPDYLVGYIHSNSNTDTNYFVYIKEFDNLEELLNKIMFAESEKHNLCEFEDTITLTTTTFTTDFSSLVIC